MNVEVVSVGTELLIGQRVNTNAARIGGVLAAAGFDCHLQVMVGDDKDRLADAIRLALGRADAVILTGGIGPTHDDVTRQAICAATGRHMTRDEEHAAWIRQRVESQGRDVTPNLLRMAELPEGASGIPNRAGVALGVALEHEEKMIAALPGVPSEMLPMLEEYVVPMLRRRSGHDQVDVSRVLKVWGQGESAVANALDELTISENPAIGLLIRDMEVEIRISARGTGVEEARRLIAPVESQIRQRLGEAVFGVDDETVQDMIALRLAEMGWTVATVEEATGGRIGATLAEAAPHAFRGTVIPPTSGERAAPAADVLLHVGPIEDLEDPTRRSVRQVAMSVTTPHGVVDREFTFGGNDERVRAFAIGAGLHSLRNVLA